MQIDPVKLIQFIVCQERDGRDGDVLKLFKKTLFLNGSSPGPIIEEEKQDVNREFGFHSPIYRETHAGAGKALSM